MMNGWDFEGANGWMMVAGMAIIAGVILMSVWVIVHRRGTQSPDNPTPADALRDRFARGEINREQFEDARRAVG